MGFPQRRLRRLRTTEPLRRLVAEHRLHPDDFIAPLFVREDINKPHPIPSLPGQFQHSHKSLKQEVARLHDVGVPAVLLFGLPAFKDPTGSQAWRADGVIQVALHNLREHFGDDMLLIADLCLCEYTSHGHCGVLKARNRNRSHPRSRNSSHQPFNSSALTDSTRCDQLGCDGTLLESDHAKQSRTAESTEGEHLEVENDATLELYSRIAVAQAEAGAHVVAPSGMMDGQVAAIRSALDTSNFTHTAILAYSAKYATALYGPFRDAVNVTIAHGGDRRTCQQNVSNARESMEEIHADIQEGADMVMVKPALPYLDVISQARRTFNVPIAAYHVSGEYAMVHAAAERGWLDLDAVAYEHILAVKRAGADMIVTYFANHICERL